MKRCILKFQIVLVILFSLILSACAESSTTVPSATEISNVSRSITTDATTEAPTEAPTESTTPAPTPDATVATEATQSTDVQKETETTDIPTPVTGTLKVSFIDVGQADSILIQNDSATMLIDAGNNGDADTILNYIKQQGISKLDYVIGTHPHEDHIGGMDAVIDTFSIGKLLMPQATTTTKTFEDVIIAIKNMGMKITTPVPGTSFDLGSAKCTIFAPNSSSYENLNSYSVVIKISFGNTSFLFTGDAEDVSEQEMLSKNFKLNADVLKVGHHGSDSSSTPEFLKAVSPKFAVISVGKGNDYGHPTQATLEKLANAKVQVYRTDESGTIIATSDGETIKFDKKASSIKPQAPPAESSNVDSNVVYITNSGAKYHADGCKYLSKSKIPISITEAVNRGYGVCSVCNPPTIESSDVKSPESSNSNGVTTKAETTSQENKETIVYITKTGAKYHTSGCSYLKKSCIPIELSDAKNSGYTPCSRCNPPR